jgi:hypothetical protein
MQRSEEKTIQRSEEKKQTMIDKTLHR